MGLFCCKPKRINYIKNSNENNNNANGTKEKVQNLSNSSPKNYQKEILKKINLIVKNLLDKDGIVAKPGQEYPISPLTDQYFKDIDIANFVFTDDVMKQDELEDFLNSCSPSTDNQEEPNSPNISETEQLLKDGYHINLCKYPDKFPELKNLMECAMRLQILHNYIDQEDIDGNSAISVALIHSNSDALIYLTKKCFARIPLYIAVEDRHYLFLIYLALNPRLKVVSSNQRQFILHILMKEFTTTNYGNDILRDYLTAVDPVYQLSLLHFLIELCLTGQCPTMLSKECIYMCIDMCPESLFVHCRVSRETEFRIDVVGRILCLANQHNVDVGIEIITNIKRKFPDAIKNGLDLYTRIIEAYKSTPEIYNKLCKCFQ